MADNSKGGCGASLVGLVILGLIVFGVFQCTRCVFFAPSPVGVEPTERPKATDSGATSRNQQSSTRSRSSIERECERRFAQRKNQVLGLHNRGLLDAYGLSDIGVLNNYGISTQAAPAVLDILEVNGLYGLQNDYSGVARAVCAEVAHDEILIEDGTRRAFVNR